MKLGKNRRACQLLSMLVGLGALTMVASGCAIRTTAPIREVAYDFSDRDFYDRGYGQSPRYETSADEIAPLRQSAAARARSLAAATTADSTPAVPTSMPAAAAVMIAKAGDRGTIELEVPSEVSPSVIGKTGVKLPSK